MKYNEVDKNEMNTPITKAKIIEQNGIPAFAVIPYHEYLKLISMAEDDENAAIPHEVVEFMIEKNGNLVRAWRRSSCRDSEKAFSI